jgi:8-oxo-dGTP diphosphatase
MFCVNCGHEWDENPIFPKHCDGCGRTHYRNPIPVVVCLVPAIDVRDENKKQGVLVVRRTLRETAGHYALPGGYIDLNDPSWREAASREIREETGYNISPETWSVFDLDTASDRKLLVFVRADRYLLSWDGEGPPKNEETDELRVVTEPEELIFPTHTAALRKYFEGIPPG